MATLWWATTHIVTAYVADCLRRRIRDYNFYMPVSLLILKLEIGGNALFAVQPQKKRDCHGWESVPMLVCDKILNLFSDLEHVVPEYRSPRGALEDRVFEL